MTDNAERRKIILAAAERLLEHYGMSKTTIADIAREAAIGVGTVYLEFGSKNDIIGHVAGRKHREILNALEAIAAQHEAPSLALLAVLDARVRAFRELASCGTHAPELVHCRCDPVQTSWQGYQRAERLLVARLLRAGIEVAEFAETDADAVAVVVLDAYASFSPPWRATALDDQFEARLQRMHELVLRGLRP